MTKFKFAAHRRAGNVLIGAAIVALLAVAPTSSSIRLYTDHLRGSLAGEDQGLTPAVRAQRAAENERRIETRCLAEAMYYEARGEGADGQKAVAEVVLHRTRDRHYPNTICGVVYQGAAAQRRTSCQFSFACDGSTKRPKQMAAWRKAQTLAENIVSGTVSLSGTDRAIAFHNLNVLPNWADTMVRTAQIGNHVFYRRAPRGVIPVNAPLEVTPVSGILLPSGEIVPIGASDQAQPQSDALVQDSGA
jgi:hypothetical protein